MSGISLKEAQLQRRAFSQYLNYLVNHRAKGVKTITEDNIPIDVEIHTVGDRINDVKEMISRAHAQING